MNAKLQKINYGVYQVLQYCSDAVISGFNPTKNELVEVWIAATEVKSASSAHASIDVIEALQMLVSHNEGSEKRFSVTAYGVRMLEAYVRYEGVIEGF